MRFPAASCTWMLLNFGSTLSVNSMATCVGAVWTVAPTAGVADFRNAWADAALGNARAAARMGNVMRCMDGLR